ncbi:MAG: carbon-nitrogen hydrolase family protein [Planctomycetes bacterium]|nr:carbon-nitrogen hydrolase family protein [Planctomycetota bacterium]
MAALRLAMPPGRSGIRFAGDEPRRYIDNAERSSQSARMKIAVAQIHGTQDIEANRTTARGLIEQAAGAEAKIVLFPEMSILEFFPRTPHRYEHFDLAEPIPGPTSDWFSQAAKDFGIHIVYNHYELSREHLCFDASVVINRNGTYIGRQRMMHLSEEPGYNEKFYYTPGWDRYHVFELEGWRFGIAICYDRHFPEVFRSFTLQGAELVLVPTAVAASEPFADIYELEMRAAAVTHGVYIAMANRAGIEDPLTFMGRSMILDPQGNVILTLDDKPNQIGAVDLEKNAVTKARALFPFLRDRRPETYDLIARTHGDCPADTD